MHPWLGVVRETLLVRHTTRSPLTSSSTVKSGFNGMRTNTRDKSACPVWAAASSHVVGEPSQSLLAAMQPAGSRMKVAEGPQDLYHNWQCDHRHWHAIGVASQSWRVVGLIPSLPCEELETVVVGNRYG